MDLPLVNNDFTVRRGRDSSPKTGWSSPNKHPRAISACFSPDSRFYKHNTTTPINQFPQPTTQTNDSFKVFARVRPLSGRERASHTSKKRLNVVKTEDNMIFVFSPQTGVDWGYKQDKSYVFDGIFDQNSATADVYQQALEPAIRNILNGYNSTILAYGMTGAGKTFTMFGDIYNSLGGLKVHPGIVSLIVKDLFSAFERESDNGYDFSIKLSYLEIYNEHARDLLIPSTEDLMIVEDPLRGTVIPNISELLIKSHDEILKLILQGNARRIMASTHANQFSSRSHAIIQLSIEKRSKAKNTIDSCLQSKLCLVDLAGSERAAASDNRGLRHREGANINRSLLALGNCINILSDSNKKGAFVPYRDSKLTRLLKDSLGGNTRTVMLACVSPAYTAYEETVNTLNYASRARNIKKKITKNVKEVDLHVSQYKEVIESLRLEVERLKVKLAESAKGGQDAEPRNSSALSDREGKAESCLDDLGRKLLGLFEENWEIKQSSNELSELRAQNEAALKAKTLELENASGDETLSNRLMEEIAALNEVMSNNEKIEKEMNDNLEKSNQEKKEIQSRILQMISQNSQTTRQELLKDTMRGVGASQQELDSGNSEDDFITQRKGGTEKKNSNKVMKLQSELEVMKKQLAEKDKLLAHNQEIIKAFIHDKSVTPKTLALSLKKSPSNRSPIKKQSISSKDVSRNSIRFGENRNAQETGFSTPVTYEIASLTSLTSPTAVRNTHAINLSRTFERVQSPVYSSAIAENGVPIKEAELKATLRKGRPEEYTLRRDKNKKQSATSSKHAAPTKPQETVVLERFSIQKKPQSKNKPPFGPDCIEDLRKYADRLNQISFEKAQSKLTEEKTGYYQHYQTKKKKQTEAMALGSNVQTYKILDPSTPMSNVSYNKTGPSPSTRSKTTTNSLQAFSQGLQNISEPIVLSATLENQAHSSQQKGLHRQGSAQSFPELSSIAQTNEASVDISVKEVLLDNLLNPEINERIISTRDSGKAQRNNKENLEVKELDFANHPITTAAYSTRNPSPKVSGRDNFTQAMSTTNKAREFISVYNSGDRGSYAQSSSIQNIGVYSGRYQADKSRSPKADSPEQANMKGGLSAEPKSRRGVYSGNPNDSGNYERPRHDIQSLDATRELVKAFKTKLHGLSNAVDNNMVDDSCAEEISHFIRDYKLNYQKIVLSSIDYAALKKLEEAIAVKFDQSLIPIERTDQDGNNRISFYDFTKRSSRKGSEDFMRVPSEDIASQDSIKEVFNFQDDNRQVGKNIFPDERNQSTKRYLVKEIMPQQIMSANPDSIGSLDCYEDFHREMLASKDKELTHGGASNYTPEMEPVTIIKDIKSAFLQQAVDNISSEKAAINHRNHQHNEAVMGGTLEKTEEMGEVNGSHKELAGSGSLDSVNSQQDLGVDGKQATVLLLAVTVVATVVLINLVFRFTPM